VQVRGLVTPSRLWAGMSWPPPRRNPSQRLRRDFGSADHGGGDQEDGLNSSRSETVPNPLMQNGAPLRDFSECALILLRKSSDFDSAIPSFEFRHPARGNVLNSLPKRIVLGWVLGAFGRRLPPAAVMVETRPLRSQYRLVRGPGVSPTPANVFAGPSRKRRQTAITAPVLHQKRSQRDATNTIERVESSGKSMPGIFGRPLITVWLAVRVLRGPPTYQ
jgi:hypothetical protein